MRLIAELKYKIQSNCNFQDYKIKVEHDLMSWNFSNIPPVVVIADRGAQFVTGLSDATANVGEQAELCCKLSSATSQGQWYKNGKLVSL